MKTPTHRVVPCLQQTGQSCRLYWLPAALLACLAVSTPVWGVTTGTATAQTQSATVAAPASPSEKTVTKVGARARATPIYPAPKVEKKAKTVPPAPIHPKPGIDTHNKSAIIKGSLSKQKKVTPPPATTATKAASVQRDIDSVLLQHARAAYWHNQIPQAIADYKELIHRHPLPRYYGELGNIYYRIGDMQAAAYNYVLAAKALIAAGHPLEAGALLPTIQSINPAAARALLANPPHSKKETH